jgi:hypothetical protein
LGAQGKQSHRRRTKIVRFIRPAVAAWARIALTPVHFRKIVLFGRTRLRASALDNPPSIWQPVAVSSTSSWRTMMALAAHIAELAEKHKLLKRRIEEEVARPGSDDAEIHRLKLEKLKLKDEIARLELNGHATRH